MRTLDFSNHSSSDDCENVGTSHANDWQSSRMNTYPPGNPEALGNVNGCYSSTRILCINNELWTHFIRDRSLQFSGDDDSHSTVAFSGPPFLIKEEKHVRNKPDR